MNDSRLIVPPLDEEPWPTLGPQVCDWLEANLVHGPGDVLGEDVVLSDELRLFIYRAYEVYPQGHARAGRRRFKRVVLSRRKGVGKTEVAGWLAIAECHPEAPVRCDGFDASGEPVGRGVRDAYLPMVATTEEQTEDLAYGTVRAILSHERCAVGEDFDIGLERVLHVSGRGKIAPLAAAPSARDGARTTFQHFDETHLFTEPRLRKSHQTMLFNIPKRKEADAWSLETTTMYGPGEGSVAEATHKLAVAVLRGEVEDPTLFFDHRQASERHDLSTKKGLRAAILEASGDASAYVDLPAVEALFSDPSVDENRARRFWLNQPRRLESSWYPPGVFEALATERTVEDRARVVLAFDGSYSRDSTVLAAATVEETPHVFMVGAWEKPAVAVDWRVPHLEVLSAIRDALERYEVVEFAPDPPGWHTEIEQLEGEYGEVVVRFDTNRPARMGPAVDAFDQAVRDGSLSHDGSEVLLRHVRNAVLDEARGYRRLKKPADDTSAKIDAAVAAVVAFSRASWHQTNATPKDPGLVVVYLGDY